MLSFECDYLEGCHEKILEALVSTNRVQQPGYGADLYSERAKEKIRRACECPEAEIYFVNGGTQTNKLVIDTMLESYEGVLAAVTGHVNVHEAGAIEFSGHKVLTLPAHEGKVKAEDVKKYLASFYADPTCEHMVFPGMLYISHPTEYGTLYSKQELTDLAAVCHEYRIPLFADGARLGYGLMSDQTDVSLPDLAGLADVFYIGGTKVGALNGEAIVFTKNNAPKHFLTHIKQHGALFAKGRLVGIQFDTLFTDDLYFEISKNAIQMAAGIKRIFSERGFSFLMDSPTNQQFPVLENSLLEKLKGKVGYSFWEPYDETHSVVRFASSWATTPEMLQELGEILDEAMR